MFVCFTLSHCGTTTQVEEVDEEKEEEEDVDGGVLSHHCSLNITITITTIDIITNTGRHYHHRKH